MSPLDIEMVMEIGRRNKKWSLHFSLSRTLHGVVLKKPSRDIPFCDCAAICPAARTSRG
jgi:hypothetical protein